MNDNILISAKQKVQDSKFNAEYLAEKNYQRAMSNADFSKISADISYINRQMAKAEIDGNKPDLEKLQTEFNGLNTKKQDVLKQLNLSDSDFKPKYSCGLCNDTGYYNDKLCRCVKKIMNDELMQLNGIDISLLNTFKNSDTASLPEKEQQRLEKALAFSLDYAINFNDKSKNLVLTGNPGTGKTFIINAIASYLYDKGFLISYNTSFSFNKTVLKYHTTFSEERIYLLDSLTDCDLLIIDDLGTEPVLKNVTVEYLYSIINDRYIKNKPTIISTNLTIPDLYKRYGERTISRLIDKNKAKLMNLDIKNLRTIKE